MEGEFVLATISFTLQTRRNPAGTSPQASFLGASFHSIGKLNESMREGNNVSYFAEMSRNHNDSIVQYSFFSI